MTNGVATINLDRCIGCGNCVVICESDAVQLKKKEQETIPLKNIAALYDKIAAEKSGK